MGKVSIYRYKFSTWL